MTFISPDPADKIEHLQLLLGLANDVNDVATTMDGPTGLGFHVPEYLAKLYAKALVFQAGEEHTDSPDSQEKPQEAPLPEVLKRKPGRPRKNTDS